MKSLTTGLVLGLIAWTTNAAADVPTYSQLPAGLLAPPPATDATKPASIRGRERAPGFVVASPPFTANIPASARYVSVVGSAASAAAVRKGGPAEGKGLFNRTGARVWQVTVYKDAAEKDYWSEQIYDDCRKAGD